MTYLSGFGEQQLDTMVDPNSIDTTSAWRQIPSAVGAGLYGAAAAGSAVVGLAAGGIAARGEDLLGLEHDTSDAIFRMMVDAPHEYASELDAKQTHYASQVLAGTIKGLGQMAFGGIPGLAVTTYADRATKEIEQGNSLTEANLKGIINSATAYAGAKIAFNIPGGLGTKVAGGVGANVAGGLLGRTGEKVVANQYDEESQNIFDPVALGTDVVMGAAFGAGGHVLDSAFTLNAKAVADNAIPNRAETVQGHAAQQEALYETAQAINENRTADYSALEGKPFVDAPDLIPRATAQIDSLRTNDAEAVSYAQHDVTIPATKQSAPVEATIPSETTVQDGTTFDAQKPEQLFTPRGTESAAGIKLPDTIRPELFEQALKDAPDTIDGVSKEEFTKQVESERNSIEQHDSFLQQVVRCLLNV